MDEPEFIIINGERIDIPSFFSSDFWGGYFWDDDLSNPFEIYDSHRIESSDRDNFIAKFRENTNYKRERLQRYHLPQCNSLRQIAHAMKIETYQITKLIFNPNGVTANNYSIYRIPRKSGGQRIISIPSKELKDLQSWILKNILYKIPAHPAAHGFVPGRSIVTNARPHIGASIVINFDLKDFFPGISYKRVKGLFRSLGYSETASVIFALLCSVTFEDKGSYLPQGAATSPAITNLISRKLDQRLSNLAKNLEFRYTRYADDMTFSRQSKDDQNISNLFKGVKHILREEGFELNAKKTRILRSSARQEVTGIVVNEKLSIDRERLRRFRALLFHIEKDGLDNQYWNDVSDPKILLYIIQGFANYVFMVDPKKGKSLINRVQAIKRTWYANQPTYY